MMNIIAHKKIYLAISGLLTLAGVISLAVFGLRQGVDFTGGTLWQLRLSEGIKRSDLAAAIPAAANSQQPGTSDFFLRLPELSEEDHQRSLKELREKIGIVEELRFESIGPIIGKELRSRALWAFALVLTAIVFYVAFAFRKVFKPVSSWKYGFVTLITLFHDAIIPTGMMAVLGRFAGIEIDTNFIVAILVVMGFSVHDTIVVFDRIRENLAGDSAKKMTFADLVNKSVNETLARSVNTSLTLVLVLIALYFLGAVNLSYFVLVILVGAVFGTYSSIFIASPLLVVLGRKKA